MKTMAQLDMNRELEEKFNRRQREQEELIKLEQKRKQIEEDARRKAVEDRFIHTEKLMVDKSGELKPMLIDKKDIKTTQIVGHKKLTPLIAGFLEADNHEQYIKENAEFIKALNTTDHQKFYNAVINFL